MTLSTQEWANVDPSVSLGKRSPCVAIDVWYCNGNLYLHLSCVFFNSLFFESHCSNTIPFIPYHSEVTYPSYINIELSSVIVYNSNQYIYIN
jgi:hypothetical protein